MRSLTHFTSRKTATFAYNGTRQDGTGRDWAGRDGTGWDGTGQDRTGQDRTKLTFKLDFPGNLWRASFANFAMFYTGFGMDYSLKLGRERAAQKLIVCGHNRG